METIKLIDENGNEKEYNVVFAYEEEKTPKGYIVYSDGIKKYLASYNTSNDDLKLYSVTDEKEIKMVKDLMSKAKEGK